MLKVATVSPNEPYREYKDVERVYSGSTEIDKILDKNGNVLFAVNKEVEGTPALTYKGKEDTNLKNYRIYGQTVDGESVGDRTGNLFDMSTIVENKYIDSSGAETTSTAQYQENKLNRTDFINVSNDTAYSLTCAVPYSIRLDNTIAFCWFDDNKSLISRDTKQITGTNISGYSFSAISPLNAAYLIINFIGHIDEATYMLNSGSTALPYEPYGYKVPVTVEGKNLLPNTATSQTINGITFTVNADKSITCNGTATNTIFFVVKADVVLESGTYVLTGCPLGGGQNTFRLHAQTAYGTIFYLDDGAGAIINYTSKIKVLITIYSGQVCNNLTFYPMIRKADIEDDTYEPYHAPITTPIYLPEPIKMVGDEAEYVDYGEQKQHRVRKNLLKNTMARQIINGVTFTANEDGSITCNGTAGASAPSVLNIAFTLAIELYEVSGCPDSGGNNTYRVDIRNNDSSVCNYNGNSVIDNGTGCLFDGGNNKNYCIRIAPGYTCDNLTFYPMIRKVDIEDDTYEPYIENTEVDVTLPALPTLPGTNTLSVGTEVQPSNVYLKGRIKEIT